MIIKFGIKKISGPKFFFDFDINDSLINFVKNLGFPQIDLRLIHNVKGCTIYKNDYLNEVGIPVTLKEYFELYFPDCPLDTEEIHLNTVLILSRFPYRMGTRLLQQIEKTVIENAEETPSILICPITQELILSAFKLNNRFYEIDAISEYFVKKYEEHRNQVIEGTFRMDCPLRMPIPFELTQGIDNYYRQNPGLEISRSSMYMFIDRYTYGHQSEYDSLLMEHKNSLVNEKNNSFSV